MHCSYIHVTDVEGTSASDVRLRPLFVGQVSRSFKQLEEFIDAEKNLIRFTSPAYDRLPTIGEVVAVEFVFKNKIPKWVRAVVNSVDVGYSDNSCYVELLDYQWIQGRQIKSIFRTTLNNKLRYFDNGSLLGDVSIVPSMSTGFTLHNKNNLDLTFDNIRSFLMEASNKGSIIQVYTADSKLNMMPGAINYIGIRYLEENGTTNEVVCQEDDPTYLRDLIIFSDNVAERMDAVQKLEKFFRKNKLASLDFVFSDPYVRAD